MEGVRKKGVVEMMVLNLVKDVVKVLVFDVLICLVEIFVVWIVVRVLRF